MTETSGRVARTVWRPARSGWVSGDRRDLEFGHSIQLLHL